MLSVPQNAAIHLRNKDPIQGNMWVMHGKNTLTSLLAVPSNRVFPIKKTVPMTLISPLWAECFIKVCGYQSCTEMEPQMYGARLAAGHAARTGWSLCPALKTIKTYHHSHAQGKNCSSPWVYRSRSHCHSRAEDSSWLLHLHSIYHMCPKRFPTAKLWKQLSFRT